jgi:hypothetical protein
MPWRRIAWRRIPPGRNIPPWRHIVTTHSLPHSTLTPHSLLTLHSDDTFPDAKSPLTPHSLLSWRHILTTHSLPPRSSPAASLWRHIPFGVQHFPSVWMWRNGPRARGPIDSKLRRAIQNYQEELSLVVPAELLLGINLLMSRVHLLCSACFQEKILNCSINWCWKIEEKNLEGSINDGRMLEFWREDLGA